MRRIIRTNIKKIVSLILSASMVMSMNTVAWADAENPGLGDAATEETVQMQEPAQIEESAQIEEPAQTVEPDDAKETSEAVDDVEDKEKAGYTEINCYKFGEYLDFLIGPYYDEGYPLRFENYEDDSHTCHFRVETETIGQLTSLNVRVFNGSYEGIIYNMNPEYVYDWSELSLFTNLTTLELNGVDNIRSISFPSSLTSLTINNCTFECIPDLSDCANLTNLTFTNNKYTGTEDFTIKGLNAGEYWIDTDEGSKRIYSGGSSTLCSLQTARFDGSDLKYIFMPKAVPEASKNLIITAEDCKQLLCVDTGDYRLINGFKEGAQYAPSFKGCTYLTHLTVKGIADSNSQTLNVNNCDRLVNPTIYYYFSDANAILELLASGIAATSGSADFGRLDGSEEGHFKLTGFSNTYLTTYASGNSLFSDGRQTSSATRFIIFDQDLGHFYEEEWWINTGSQRDYVANPIVLRPYIYKENSKGEPERVPDTIYNDTPHFFTEDGIALPDGGYSYEIIVDQKPTDAELRTAGFKETQISNYQVISASKDSDTGRLSVTACNPGVARLKINKSVGNSSVSASQVIIVTSPIKSGTIDSNSADGSSDNLDIYDKSNYSYNFRATLTPEFPSLAQYTYGNVEWDLYRRTSNGTYELYSTSTNDGLRVYASASDTTIDSDKKIHASYTFEVKRESGGGELAIGGKVMDNCNTSGSRTEIPNDYHLTVTKLGTNLHNAAKDDAHPEDFILGYQFGNYDNKLQSTIDFTIPAFTSNGYVSNLEVVDTSHNESKYFKFIENGTGKYKLAFNSEKSSKEICEFLKSLGDNNNVTVKLTVEKGGITKTFTETVSLAGRFNVEYDYAGGSLAKDKKNITAYYIPTVISKVYPQSDEVFTLTNKPSQYGYEFDKWMCDGKEFTGVTNESVGNLKVTAQWIGLKFNNSLYYDLNIEVPEDYDKPKSPQVEEVTFPNTKYSHEVTWHDMHSVTVNNRTYKFLGWFTDPVGGTEYEQQSNIEVGSDNVADNQSMTLYAHWDYESPAINTASLTFSRGKIGLNFYMINMKNYLPDGIHDDAYISIGDVETKIEENVLTDPTNDDQYRFSTFVSATNIEDQVEVHVYRKDSKGNKTTIPLLVYDGEGYVECEETDGIFMYSVADYMQRAHEAGLNEDVLGYLDAIRDYGKCARNYFGLENKDGVPSIKAADEWLGEGFDEFEPKIGTTLPEGVTYVGSSLLLKSSVIVRHYFSIDNPENLNRPTFKGDEIDFETKDGLYYVDVEHSLLDLGCLFPTVVSDNKTSFTINYSPMNYCGKVIKKSNNDDLKNLANSMYWVNFYGYRVASLI